MVVRSPIILTDGALSSTIDWILIVLTDAYFLVNYSACYNMCRLISQSSWTGIACVVAVDLSH
jgi:hypothetical protein